jgi:hypothetical protein
MGWAATHTYDRMLGFESTRLTNDNNGSKPSPTNFGAVALAFKVRILRKEITRAEEAVLMY